MRPARLPWPLWLSVAVLWLGGARAQSNYASQANNVDFVGEGLPEEATLDGRVTRLDDLSPVIALNRTRAALNCAAGSMEVELKFKQPFFGLAYADFDRNSACQLSGSGAITYTLELPLKGCGTKQEPQRVFTNNIVVRFHPGLEMDGDEIITIVCRYPPPVAPQPAGLPAPILDTPVAPAAVVPPLKGFHILLIICAILFLSLLLLGLSCSYVCLKKRNIRVVRRAPLAAGSGTASEITKLSGSSLGNLSLFEGLRIPRAHAPLAAAGSTSGSEAQLILASRSDTIPSDYPSESPSSAHSEVEDVDTRSLRRPSSVSSAASYDNKAFVHSEALYAGFAKRAAQAAQAVPTPPPPPPPEPHFDVSVRVRRAAAPPPPPTPPPSDVESSMSAQARHLTSILERSEVRIPVAPPPPPQVTTFAYVPELHPPPASPSARYAQTPPVYSRILRRQQEHVQTREADARDALSERSIPDNDNWSQGEDLVDAPQRRLSLASASARSLTSLNTEMTDTRSLGEMVDATHQRYVAASVAPPPPPPPPIAPPGHYTASAALETAEPLEPPLVAQRRPEITTHIVDDVFLQTITEKRTVEDVERHRRQVTEFRAPPAPAPDPQWDVVIRNYPDPNAKPATPGAGAGDAGTDWESFSEASSMSGAPTTPVAERHRVELQRSYREERPPQPPRWEALARVLDETAPGDAPGDAPDAVFRSEAALTVEERDKWRQIITTESTLRTLLSEATVREDFERIRRDQRYEQLFAPEKWDVIIRVLAPPERPAFKQSDAASGGGARYRRKAAAAAAAATAADWDTRSRRSSLPTLYEYDSDGGSSVRTLTAEGPGAPAAAPPAARSRRTSRSSLRSDIDVRSMTEVTVDFARPERADSLSDASASGRSWSSRGRRHRGFYDGYATASDDEDDGGGGGAGGARAPSLARSASQPSLARSASEFTEHWAAPAPATGDLSSPEQSPRPARLQHQQHLQQQHLQLQRQTEQRIQQHLAASAPPPPGVARELVITATTSSVRETYEQGWFGDGDSEASFK